ncbi:hypothetical protein J6590_076156 [Homalodisca vitripennis]|nr:hypothetical protein J6590_076156 [Homalodisca vitripennis]
MSVFLVLLYAVCLLLLTMYLRFRWQYSHVLAIATKLPCPPTLPIIGNALLFFVHIWRKYRRLMNPVMHPSNVENFLPVFNEVSRKLTEQLSVSSPPSDRTDEIFEMAVTASTSNYVIFRNGDCIEN